VTRSLPDALRTLFERMVRVTVAIRNPRDGKTGSGVVITQAGLILTAQHVTTGAKTMQVKRCRLKKGKWSIVREGRYTADVIFEDRKADIAVLLMRRPPKTLKAAELGDSESLKIGEPVFRVGLDQYEMDGGHIIGLGRHEGLREISVSILADVGSSGGPLFDTALQVVGIVLRVDSSPKVPSASFALPLHVIKRRIFRRKVVKVHLPDDET
jgi:serine protease Do